MAATKPVTEADLESAFREGADFGIEYLDCEFQQLVVRYIKSVTRGCPSIGEMLEIYQDVLIGVWKKIKEPGFNPSRPLRIVYRIARCKAVDHRRQRKHRANTNQDGILGAVAASVKDTDLGFQWKIHMGPAEVREFRKILPEIIATLPPRQRLVAECFKDHFEDFRGERDVAKPLADAVSAVTGKTENVVAVMSAWRFAREKIAAELQRRGFTFIQGE